MKKHLAGTLCWLLLLVCGGFAQEFRATVNGRVVDPNGAAVPGATVVIRNTQTNETATVTTNSDGAYNVPFLKPGTYTLTAEARGFKKYQRDNQLLQVSQTATIDISLEVGAASETVTITAEAVLLDESKADRGNVIENRRIVELPLNARNPFMLATLTPGITYNGPAIYQRPFDNGAIADWSVNGGQNRNNEFLLDGAPNNSIQGGNNLAYVPPVDAVGEFKIITNSFDAQYGRTSGGIINVEIKSGGNQFHGSLYEFMRRNSFDANNVLANTQGIPAGRAKDPATGKFIPAEHFLDQYGGVISGPVRLPKALFRKLGYDGRDKTFFMFNYEGYREGTPNPAVRTVPTEAFLRGDFSQYKDAAGNLIVVYDPATATAANNFVRQPFQGNIIQPNRINPVAAKILGLFPKANTTPASGDPWRNNFADLPNIANDKFKNWIFKIDQNLGARDKVFFRYGYNNRAEIRWTNGVTTGPAQDGQLPLNRINYAGVADWVHTFNSTTVLNIRASANRYIEAARFQDGLGYDITQLGFSSALASQLPQKLFPRLNFSDFISLGRNGFSREPTNVYSFQPNISTVKGAHTLRFGLDLRYSQYARLVSGNGAGMQLNFDRTFTQKDPNVARALEGSSIAAFLLGIPTGLNSSFAPQSLVDYNVFPIYMFKYYAPWIQDDWKITRRLTLNLGFRWDFNGPAVERYNRLNYGFDPAVANTVSARVIRANLLNGSNLTGGLGFVGGANGNSPVKYDKKDLQPRLGFAYSLNQKTVIRGGFGRYYLNPTGSPGYSTNGFSLQTPLIASLDNNVTALPNLLSNPFPSGIAVPPGSKLGVETALGRGFSYSNPNFTVPYVQNFSLGVQRQLPFGIAAEISYVGSRTYNGQSQFNGINEPTQAFRDKCDILKGGTPAFCNENLPNPFKGVTGFEGTAYFFANSISRYNLNRPYPQFLAITELERNEGKVWYNSAQVLVNKRFSKGLSVNGTYTFSKSIEEATQLPGQQDSTASYIDDVARIKNRSLSFADRPHRFTISGVWEVPVGKGRKFLGGANRWTDLLVGGWEAAGNYIFNSGRPWQLPGNVDIVDPNYGQVDRLRTANGIQYIQGVKPCAAQYDRNTDGTYRRDANGRPTYTLTSNSVRAGCTAPSFVIREQYMTRVLPIRDAHIRRPSFEQFDINLSKRFRITEKTSFQFRAEAYNVFNTPQYDERAYNTDPTSFDFGGINKAATGQSNFPRFWQLGFKFLF